MAGKIFRFMCFVVGQVWAAFLPLLVGMGMVCLQLVFHAVVVGEGGPNNSMGEPANGVAYPLFNRLFALIALPDDFWHRIVFTALCLSVFSAFVLYYHFPASYRFLKLSAANSAILHFVIPTAQAFCIAYAFVMITNPRQHAMATALYLALFVLWDKLILRARRIEDTDGDARGKKFQSDVQDYFDADKPYLITLLFLFWVSRQRRSFRDLCCRHACLPSRHGTFIRSQNL